MTFLEMQAAARTLVHGARLSDFTLTVQAVEHHANRVEVRWQVFVPRDPPLQALYRSSIDPADLLAWLRHVLATVPEAAPPAALVAIGEIPEDDTPVQP